MHTKPQITASESQELALDSYVMYIHNHECTACGCCEQFSQIFEVWLHPTKTRLTNFRDLRPAVGALKPLPLRYIEAPHQTIPICSDCVSLYRAPQGERIKPISNMDWQETLKRKYAPPAAEPKVAKQSASPQKAVPTLDQI